MIRCGFTKMNSSLRELKDDLAKQPREDTLAERITAAAERAGSSEHVPGGNRLSRAMGRIAGMSQALVQAVKDLPKWTNWDEHLVKNYLGPRQLSEGHLTEVVKELQRRFVPERGAVPKEQRHLALEAMPSWIEANGDVAKLSEWAEKTTDPKLKRGYIYAQTMSGPERAAAGALQRYFAERFAQGHAAGILEHGVENYITHLWGENPDHPYIKGFMAELNSGLFQKNFRYGLKRTFSTFFEGEQAGLTPKNKRIDYLLAHYDQSFNDALAARSFIGGLPNGKAEDGRPLGVYSTDLASPSFVDVKSGASMEDPQAYFIKPGKRGPMVDVQDAAKKNWRLSGIPEGVLQDITSGNASRLNARAEEVQRLTEQGLLKTLKDGTVQGRLDISDYRRINHPQFTGYRYKAQGAEGAPVYVQSDMLVHKDIAGHLENLFKPSYFDRQEFVPRVGKRLLQFNRELKSIALSFSAFHYGQEAYHAATHKINPFSRDIWSGETLRKGLEDANVRDLINHGMMVYDRHAAQLFYEGGQTWIEKAPLGIGEGWSRIQSHLFQTFIPGLKIEMAKEVLARNRARYGARLSDDQILKVTASEANAAFGELNWRMNKGLANKTTQDVLRGLLLAPDFLLARGQFALQGAGTLLGKPYAEQGIALLLRSAIPMYFTSRIANAMLNDGDMKWQAKHAFSIVAPGGTALGGTKGRVLSLRSVPGDLMHAASDPWGFMSWRMSPVMRGFLNLMDQRAKISQKPFSVVAKEFAEAVVPIPARGLLLDYFKSRTGSDELGNALFASFGIHTSRYLTAKEEADREKKLSGLRRFLQGETRRAPGRAGF